MLLIKIIFTYVFGKLVSFVSCIFSFSFYKGCFSSLLVFLSNLFECSKHFMFCNKIFYLVPSDSGFLVCLFFSFVSFFNMMVMILFFYSSCPILFSYFTNVIYFFIYGVTAKFKYKFYEVNTYLIVLLSYLVLFFLLFSFYVLLFLYLILFLHIFYYNTFSFLVMIFSLF